ncbi:hypothetical protein Gohar_007708 [Gossypium harknessii]|uniref:Uncharacterized protein n=1 Tax=Gossypium harknessii TaxID=34285 RepID=A0A7J9GHD1_9ROSI|nr:hypothetical protein [Gossypium harknessii]
MICLTKTYLQLCATFIDPTNPDDMFSSPTEQNTEAVEAISPAMIFPTLQWFLQ